MPNDRLNESSKTSEQLIVDLSAQVESLANEGVEDATEQVLQTHSEVAASEELIISLLYAEIIAAEQNSRTLSAQALINRFPELSERISRLVAFHETVNPTPEFDDPVESASSQAVSDADTSRSVLDTDRDQKITQHAGRSRPQPIEIDQFEILEKIGQGGMGIVYRARQKDLDRIVALKVLRNPLLDSDDRQRLMNEAQAVARLKHSGIVQIYQVGETSDQPYLCFEYVDGSHLGERLARSTMSPEDACKLLRKVASAISFAHEQGIIHRDLKPANILIDADGEPKVADFGLAKLLDCGEHKTNSDRLTKTGALVGTICYMAPEQFTGLSENVDYRADIYGLGTILYEMLVGRPPLIGDTPDETMYLVRTVDPAAPRKLNPKIPRDVETICLKCLEKEPDRRFQSGAELELELKRFLNGQPLSIRPTSSITIATRWCKRRPAIALLSALSALLMIALSIGGYWMAWNQTQHAQKLQEQRDLARTSADLAAQKADEADKATQFMVTTLGSAHPNRDGRNVTVAERLADGLREIQDSFSDASTGKAALLSAIGKTYNGLGLHHDARVPLQQAWELYSQLNGKESLEALKAETAYGDLLRKLGRYKQAEQHLVHSRDGLIGILGPNASESIVAANNVAQNLYEQGLREEAFSIFADSYERAKQSLAALNETTINTLLAYSDALTRAGKIQTSRELIEDALPSATEFYGPDHLWVISLNGALASIERADGNYQLAMEIFKEINAILMDKLGEDHLKTITSLNGVAISHADMGNNKEASKMLHEIRDRMARVMGECHPQTLRSILNLARSMETNDLRNEARELLKNAYEQSSLAVGYDHPDTMMMATQYGRSLAENNQFEEAETLLTDAVMFFEKAENVEPMTRAEPFTHLGALYKRTERTTQAVELYATALEIAREAHGETNPTTLSAKNNLAGAYFKLGQMDEAIQLFQEVLDGLRQKLGDDNPRTVMTALNLGISYRDEDRPDEAIVVLSDIVPILQRDAKGSWLTNTAQFQLGRAYLDSEQVDAANQDLEIAYKGFEKLLAQQPASKTIGLANQIKTIISQFVSLGETDIADSWRQRRQSLLDAQQQPSMDD